MGQKKIDKINSQKKQKLTASNLTRQIIIYLRQNGYFVWRQNNVPVYHNGVYRAMPFGSIHGVPDIIGFTDNGTALFIEVKVGNDRLSDAQKRFMQASEKSGCLFFVAKSFEQFVFEFENKTKKIDII